MNNERRKQVTDAVQKLREAQSILETVESDEQQAFDNIPENMASSERADKMSEAIDTVSTAKDEIDSMIQELETLQ